MGAIIDWLLGREPVETRSLQTMRIATAADFPNLPITEMFSGGGYDQSLPAAYRARLMTINTVGQLPLVGDPRSALVRRPDPDITRQQFVRETVAELVDNGNAFWRLIPGGGNVASIKVAARHDVTVTWADTARTRRRYTWQNQPMRHGRDIVHIAMGRASGELLGRGPLQHRRLAGVAEILRYSQDYYFNNGDPAGTLKSPLEYTDEEADAHINKWMERHSTRTIGFLSGGMDYERGGASPADADWVGTHGAGILDVAQIFGIKAALLGYSQPGSALTYSNIQDQYLGWWRETLQPDYVAPIEEAWSDIAGEPVELDPLNLIRGDIKSRYEAYEIGIRSGVLLQNEARQLEGRDPVSSPAPRTMEVTQ